MRNTLDCVPGHDPREAVENYRAPIARALRTLNPEAFLVPGRGSYNYSVGAEGYWLLVDENGLRLKPRDSAISSMRFHAEQRYRIVDCDPSKHDPELGCYRVTTVMYAYKLVVNDSTLWSMHWHPIGQGDEYRPHLHLAGGDGAPFSIKDHLPTGRHTIEDAIEWCVTLGAEAADDNWADIIAETKGVHVLHRSWSVTPDEPHS